jgi:hypothetical protein
MLKVKINATHNFTAVELVKLNAAVRILETVVNSQEFKVELLNYTFIDTNGLTNYQIYNLIMSGKEILSLEEDNEIDVDISMYYRWNSVIGYTYPNTLRTWINRRFFNRMTTAEIASNIMHENLHKLGFDHSFYYNKQRQNSVPYAIGSMIARLNSL